MPRRRLKLCIVEKPHAQISQELPKLWRENFLIMNAVKLLKYNMMIKDFDMDIDGWVNQWFFQVLVN